MSKDVASAYVGRFAPSPTGPLHFGSLLAACASYLDAKSHAGQWLLRIEDIDPPREMPGASEAIVEALARFGFEWDGPVIYQSRSADAHLAALEQLDHDGLTYACGCSRRDLADEAEGPLGTIYPGTCRDGTDADEVAIRVRVADEDIVFEDGLQGRRRLDLVAESGDFVVRRKDGLIAYHLAVVVDDHLQGVTHIVRGMDLIDSTPRQIWLQRCLGYETPEYLHIPVAVHDNGDKLSKLTGARAVGERAIGATLYAALRALRQAPPDSLGDASPADIWDWAIRHWNREPLRGLGQIPVQDFGDY